MDGLFINILFADPVFYVSTVLVVMFSICVHEFAHAFTASKLGDDTAALSGHLSLNPMKQMGPISIVILLIIGIAWGMVPINPRRVRQGRKGLALIAFAGPFANLFLCALFGVIWSLTDFTFADVRDQNPAAILLFQGAVMNGALFLLNLLPFPPLDGFTIAQFFIQPLRNIPPHVIQQISMFALIILFASGIGSYIFSGGMWIAQWFMI